ncbi:MAG TPA: uroporphyrinogen decarboxylase [Candidatus Saccharimonadia bacterium]|nr:uroporphyrinogen decarboxylase [Candidatus Saccharimonadia bacterium]
MAVAAFNDTFIRAALGQTTDHTPVWFMRQAGRYMPEYRKLREKYDVLTLAQTPELAAQVSLQPVKFMPVDAAILFADIMLVPIAMGAGVRIVDAIGPVIDEPIQTQADIDKLHDFGAPDIDYISQTIKILKGELTVPLIGFSGAPFTLASYLIEGKPTREWHLTKKLMYDQPNMWHNLMRKLTTSIIFYLREQIRAGAGAIQLFDSWVGCLSAADFRQFVQPYNHEILAAIKTKGVPRIVFGTDTAAMLTDFADPDCEVVGLDWRIDLPGARRLLPHKALQGNLDPAVLACSWNVIENATNRILASLPNRTGYIFNLGHGVWKDANPDTLKHLVEYIHAY